MFHCILAAVIVLLCALPSLAQSQPPQLSRDQLAALIPYKDKLGDFATIQNEIEEKGTSSSGDHYQSVRRIWGRGQRWKPDAVPRGMNNQPAVSIRITLVLYSSPKQAKASFRDFVQGSSAVMTPPPSMIPLGDNFGTNRLGTNFFVDGRAFVVVNVLGTDTSGFSYDDGSRLSEALARSIEYTLCTHKDLTQAQPGSIITLRSAKNAPPALVLNGNAWAPLATLEALGVQAARNADNTYTLRYKEHTLTVSPLSRTVQRNGKPLDLALPILQTSEQIVLPIVPVAHELHLRLPKELAKA